MKKLVKIKKISGPIGILGGMGPQATIDLYRKIIDFAVSKGAKNDEDFPELIISSVTITEIINLDGGTDTRTLENLFLQKIKGLESAGATRFAVACNTAHLIINKVIDKVEIPLISMIDLVCDRVVKNKCQTVGILGSPTTVRSGLYSLPLFKMGIGCLLPNSEQLAKVEKVIRAVLAGKLQPEDKRELTQIIFDLLDRGADCVILGCTELPLAVDPSLIGNKLISSTDELAQEIILQSGL